MAGKVAQVMARAVLGRLGVAVADDSAVVARRE